MELTLTRKWRTKLNRLNHQAITGLLVLTTLGNALAPAAWAAAEPEPQPEPMTMAAPSGSDAGSNEGPLDTHYELTSAEKLALLKMMISEGEESLSPWDVNLLKGARADLEEGHAAAAELKLARVLLRNEELISQVETERPLTHDERTAMLKFLMAQAPKSLKKRAESIVTQLRRTIAEALGEETKGRGTLETLQGTWNRLRGKNYDEQARYANRIDATLAQLAERLSQENPEFAFEFLNQTHLFFLLIQDTVVAVAQGYPSIDLHSAHLQNLVHRFGRSRSFSPSTETERTHDAQIRRQIAEREVGTETLRIYLNRDTTSEIGARALVGLMITGAVLTATGTVGTGTPVAAGLLAGAEAVSEGMILSRSALNIADRSLRDGVAGLTSADSALDLMLLATLPVSRLLGAAGRAVGNSRWFQSLTVPRMIQSLAASGKGVAIVRGLLATSASFGAFQLGFADQISAYTGQSPSQIRTQGALFLSIGLLGGWKSWKALRQRAERAEQAALAEEELAMKGASTAEAAEATEALEANATQAPPPPKNISSWFKDLSNCVDNKPRSIQNRIFWRTFLGDLGQNTVQRVAAVANGTLRVDELPLEIGAFATSQVFSYFKNRITAGPRGKERFRVTWVRVSSLSSGRALADSTIYLIMPASARPKYKGTTDMEALQRRTAYNMSWAWIASLGTIPSDRMLAGLQCMYPFGKTGAIAHAGVRYLVNQGWGMLYFAGRHAALHQDKK